MQRIVFINLHGNEMLVKTMNKFVFKQSVAIKHKYLLDYLLDQDNIEVCSFINEKGFSMASSLPTPIMKVLNLFRFLEHRIVMKKNGIDRKKITVLKKMSDIKDDDIVILYRHCASQLYNATDITAFKAISMIHFWGKRSESAVMEEINPTILVNEIDLGKHSEIFQRFYSWYQKEFIVHPFVFAPRFQNKKPFAERECKAFATGTITYKNDPDFLEVYGDPCDQPARKQIKDNADALSDLIYCTCSDYAENAKSVKVKHDNPITRIYRALHYKLFESQQKAYYSFDMVKSFNNYKMCIVGEEILGIPGIGFVEGMACGCAYIGQNKGYYEDYGMQDGVHYIGYDGTLEDLTAKIRYYQRPENQDELERIAATGCQFVRQNFCGPKVAQLLLDRLKSEQQNWLSKQK